MPNDLDQTETTTTSETVIEQPAAGAAEGGEGSGAATEEVQEDPAAADEGSGEGEGGAEGTEAAGKEGAYKPNLKFKADDKEYEIPKELASLIKDEATEKKMVELLQKSYGLDAVKTRAETVRQQRDEFKTKVTQYDGIVKELRDHYNRGDIDMWMDKLGVDKNKMLQWALDKVNYSQLTPEQKAIRDAETTASRKAYELEQQNAQLQNVNRDTQVQAMQTALNYEFSRPEVGSFQKQFDEKVGKDGAFFEAVTQKGQSAYALSGGKELLTPAQAVAAVMKDFAGFFAAPGAGTQTNPNAPKVVQPNSAGKTTIPNVQGKQSSPVGQAKPKNLAELRAIAQKAGA